MILILERSEYSIHLMQTNEHEERKLILINFFSLYLKFSKGKTDEKTIPKNRNNEIYTRANHNQSKRYLFLTYSIIITT